MDDPLKQPSLFKTDFTFPGYGEGGRVYVWVKAKAKAPKAAIQGLQEDAKGNIYLKLTVTAPPENNKANEAFRELLSAIFKIPTAHINLVSGPSSGFKKFSLEGLELTQAKALLEPWLN
jgi:uncharacterized protein YggU (UPF0235/DUF167 family)